MLLVKGKIFFWQGYEYLDAYLTVETFNQYENLVSEELLTKLVYLYDVSQLSHKSQESTNIDLGGLRITYCVQQQEPESWFNLIKGEAISNVVNSRPSRNPKISVMLNYSAIRRAGTLENAIL